MLKAQLGTLAISVGFAAAAGGVAALGLGLGRRDRRLLRAGRHAALYVLAAAVAAAAVMEWALVTHDFSLRYVADNGSRATPLLYTIASLWGALEGSILLWAVVLGAYLVAMVRRFRDRADDPLLGWALLTGLVVAAFFFGLMLGPADPFRLVEGAIPADGRGPNPLLQNHPLMAFHPPILYLGYVGFTVPFAFAVGALVTGRLGEGWLAETRRATLLAFGCLTAGIVLGGWWSYEVLGWGGYWAWDPVENASLLPWLTATAYLHSVLVQERRGMLRVWNLSLVAATFALTIFGTLLTRSGMVNSVHAFTQSAIGPALLGFLAVIVLVSVGLIGWRADVLRGPGRIDSPVSREGAFLANNLLFAGFALVVLVGTVFPLVAEAYDGRQLSVGEPYFDTMTRPIGIALLFLMAVAPALPWRAAGAEVLHRRLIVSAWLAAVAMLAAAIGGVRGLAPLAAVGLGGFAVGGIARSFAAGLRARRNVTGERRVRALVNMVAANSRLYGGLIVHLGVVLVAVAFTFSSAFSTEREAVLRRGESASIRGYTVTYLGDRNETSAGKRSVSVDLAIERGDRSLGAYAPALTTFAGSQQAIGTPSVRNGWREDVYLTLIAAPENGRAVVGMRVNPLVMWLWIGAGVMVAGTAVAAWPAKRRRSKNRDNLPATRPVVEPAAELAAVGGGS